MGTLPQLIYLANLSPSVRATSASNVTVVESGGLMDFVLDKDIWFCVPDDLEFDTPRRGFEPVHPMPGAEVTLTDASGARTLTATVVSYTQSTRTLRVNVTAVE